jgi:oxygen-independent coproporphyrinogen-3 oxidase
MVNAIIQDIELKQNRFPFQKLNSIYFGGGTPSLLTKNQLRKIFTKLKNTFNWSENIEITLEANPDDLNIEYLQTLKEVGVNRLSIGIQAFQDDILQWMNRSHNSNEAMACVENAAKIGFENITIDLIYGIPQLSEKLWIKNIQTAFNLPISHLSAYSLTLEPKTPYAKLVQQKKYLPPENEQGAKHFELLQKEINKTPNWEQYEVSNFAKNQCYSVHNSAYWKGKPYIGVGPSAHGYYDNQRYANVSNNDEYIENMEWQKPYCTLEELTSRDRANELIMTGLRLTEGFDLSDIGDLGLKLNPTQNKIIEENLKNGMLLLDNGRIQITEKGMLFADHIASELFFLDE